ncbi:phosphate ABC transporter substrate-binding protein PstS [Synechococcus sp. ATX 2A4]|uniref:phosphate ABC transporter substrate-binding protein PstS n=1 Tax=Synechococcus sp. ATX 2A4 TaxID=2823727 RepID=UPI0020CD143D|nr:phosphate ABC transporter substrate-binding protein PstS [Synechococcus sp. ATX 2A4]MCP9885497.1 phosphate ABC transporter substrate-binding protein PstS [Synechococcus sp. ATX 2A4]
MASSTRLRRHPLARLALPLGLGAAMALTACGGGGEEGGQLSGTLNGAGASFPSSIYQSWFQQLASTGLKVNYQSVGSGAGVRQFIAGTVDFGASDAPMDAEDLAKVSRGTVQVPMTAGAIAVAYNLPGCELKLTQAQVADVFLGKITNFNELGCADQQIKVVHRSDGSGTTYNFTNSLAAFSEAWKSGPGAGKAVAWPVGVGAKGNEGVAANLGQNLGSIGYVETSFVKGDMQAAALQNKSGDFAKPDNENASRALAAIDLGPDLIGSDPNPAAGYPIVTFTWILLYKTGNGKKAEMLKKVFNTTLSEEFQSQAPTLGYVSLPPEVVTKAKAAVDTIGE